MRIAYRVPGLGGNSQVTRPLGSSALVPSPPHSSETLLIKMNALKLDGPSHHLSVTWMPILPKAQERVPVQRPLRTHPHVVGFSAE